MARKTLSEKRISDSRHLYRFEKTVAPTLKIQTHTETLQAKDLLNTIILTTAFLGLQVILFLFLKSHLIRIPGISY